MLLAGCTAPAVAPVAAVAAVAAERPWAFDGVAGRELRSPHYRLLTTVADRAVTARFLCLMEAAHTQYAALLPPDPTRGLPLDIFLFARPEEWETFTRRLTGRDAPLYLSVGPGGYAYGDRFVCWLANPDDLWTVAAHEGFHQYVARHARQRLPPALEEGLATTFENVRVGDTTAEFVRTANPRREQGLRDARRAGVLLPLGTLVTLNAGDVAGQSLAVREGFYGQCWLLAGLLERDPKYADRFAAFLTRVRDGRARPAIDLGADARLYRPAAVRPMLSDGLALPWDEIDRDYRRRVDATGGDPDGR